MGSFIRLKRRLEDAPTETLILSCKKRRTDENEENEVSTIIKLAGTISSKQDDIYTHLPKPTKEQLKEDFKKHNVDLSTKLRIQKQEDSKKSRYKVVNCLRLQKSDNTAETSSTQLSDCAIYDLENETQEIGLASEKDTKYVYDLYYTTCDDLGDDYFEDYVNMYPYNDKLIYGSMRDNGANGRDSDDDSEDSNAENNWRNDYPDESDMESITEDDMVQAMKKCDLDDLSSDDGEEGFIYSIDSEGAGFEEDVCESDVQRYGERYARFKARHKKNIQTSGVNDLYFGDIDEEEYYY